MRTKTYFWSKPLPNGKMPGRAVFETLSSTLGSDFEKWPKNPKFKSTLQFCHTHIFNEPGKYKGGLELQVYFLTQAPNQKKATKSKRQCYNERLVDALEAGVINNEQYRSYSK